MFSNFFLSLSIKAALPGGTETAGQRHENEEKFQGILCHIKVNLVQFCAISRDPT